MGKTQFPFQTSDLQSDIPKQPVTKCGAAYIKDHMTLLPMKMELSDTTWDQSTFLSLEKNPQKWKRHHVSIKPNIPVVSPGLSWKFLFIHVPGDDFDYRECKKRDSKVKTKAGVVQVVPGGSSLADK